MFKLKCTHNLSVCVWVCVLAWLSKYENQMTIQQLVTVYTIENENETMSTTNDNDVAVCRCEREVKEREKEEEQESRKHTHTNTFEAQKRSEKKCRRWMMKNVNIQSERKVNVFLIVTDNLLYIHLANKQCIPTPNTITTSSSSNEKTARLIHFIQFQHAHYTMHSCIYKPFVYISASPSAELVNVCVSVHLERTIKSITGSLFNSHVAETYNLLLLNIDIRDEHIHRRHTQRHGESAIFIMTLLSLPSSAEWARMRRWWLSCLVRRH